MLIVPELRMTKKFARLFTKILFRSEKISSKISAYRHPSVHGPMSMSDVFPIFNQNSSKRISFKNISCPSYLLNGKTLVTNSLDSRSNTIAISGMNGTGKTMFLMKICQNVILAQCGFPVAASEFKLRDCFEHISINGMDLNFTNSFLSNKPDSSVFITELSHVLKIFEKEQSRFAITNCLLLLDELFRGTNLEKGQGLYNAVISSIVKCSEDDPRGNFVISNSHYGLKSIESDFLFYCYFDKNHKLYRGVANRIGTGVVCNLLKL